MGLGGYAAVDDHFGRRCTEFVVLFCRHLWICLMDRRKRRRGEFVPHSHVPRLGACSATPMIDDYAMPRAAGGEVMGNARAAVPGQRRGRLRWEQPSQLRRTTSTAYSTDPSQRQRRSQPTCGAASDGSFALAHLLTRLVEEYRTLERGQQRSGYAGKQCAIFHTGSCRRQEATRRRIERASRNPHYLRAIALVESDKRLLIEGEAGEESLLRQSRNGTDAPIESTKVYY